LRWSSGVIGTRGLGRWSSGVVGSRRLRWSRGGVGSRGLGWRVSIAHIGVLRAALTLVEEGSDTFKVVARIGKAGVGRHLRR